MKRRWVASSAFAECRISSHNFRHTFASLLIVELKYDVVSVSRQMGHTPLPSRATATAICSIAFGTRATFATSSRTASATC